MTVPDVETPSPAGGVATTPASQPSQPPQPRRLKAQYRQPQPASTDTSTDTSTSLVTTSHPPAGSSPPVSRPTPPVSLNSIPASLLHDPALNAAILSSLPPHYNFEVHKTIHRLLTHRSRRVALQLPEGLLAYSTLLSDLLSTYAGVDCVILGDVTYGACCVDDFTAKALGCDALVHYGHSCLVPIDVTSSPTFLTLYVFVDVQLDLTHLCRSLEANFPPTARLLLAATIQFAASLQAAAPRLLPHFPLLDIPQVRPLSRGEVLGCTSPRLPELGDDGAVVFVADGRFHLESLMIHNPHITAYYKYDPYSRRLTREAYDHAAMHGLRRTAIGEATKAQHWGLVLGALGRQGAPHLLQRLQGLLTARGVRWTTFLLSEVQPGKLALLTGEKEGRVGAFVQVACPRLSVDWGHEFGVPVLNGYEAEVALGQAEWRAVYPMDYYANDGGEWSVYAERQKTAAADKQRRAAERKERLALREEKRKLKEEGQLVRGEVSSAASLLPGNIAYDND